MKLDKSRSPYFDDFNPEQNYHEVLFVPSRPVQVRELNQIQSMFYKQIERFGDHIFKDGDIVIPGSTNYDLEVDYVAGEIANFDNIIQQLASPNLRIVATNGIEAQVVIFNQPTDVDPATFYIRFLRGSNDGLTSKFANEEVDLVIDGVVISTLTITSSGVASKFTIDNGVYYLAKRFVAVEHETVLLDKYNNQPNAIVAIEFNEVTVTENNDSSLFDNAQGTTNFSAPGAHRLRVDSNLRIFPLNELETLPNNVIEIFRIKNGVVQKHVKQTQYNLLADSLAQRTFEESGDYTVKPFGLDFEDTTNPENFNVVVDPGLAYVKGYRIETVSPTKVEVERARTSEVINNSSVSAAIGHYIIVENLNTIPELTTLQKINFYDVVNDTAGTEPAGTILGSARVRFVERDGANYRLYLFDVRDNNDVLKTGFISNALSIFGSGSEPVTADLVESELFDPIDYPLVFLLPVENVKTLYDDLGNSDTTFSTVKQYNTTSDSNGIVTISASSNESFVAQDDDFSFAVFTDADEFAEVVGNFSLGGVPVGSVINVDFGIANAGRPVRLNLQVSKQQAVQKTKTLQNTSVSGSLTNNRLSLNKADAYQITSILDNNGLDVTDKFTLDTNKNLSFYNVSFVQTNQTVVEPITVNFSYFQHSAGDFFGADSYVDLDYEDIPSESFGRLSDVVDFRPRISDTGTSFSGSGSVVGNIPIPFTIIRSDVDHYLSRIDKVYVDKRGTFGVAKGIPSLNPKPPADPSDSMVLYTTFVPAYTFNVKDIDSKQSKTRRYTMNDIGELDQRLSNVEYYVSLSQLEQNAESKQIVDATTGLNRFKNGILTDAFVDHSVGDYGWDGYHIALGSRNPRLSSEFSLGAIDLQLNESNSSNFVVNNGIATLPFTNKSYISQKLRSNSLNVNPYAIYRWTATVKLNPSVDAWIDQVYTDGRIVTRDFNVANLNQTIESWQANWTGFPTTSSSSTNSSSSSRNVNDSDSVTFTRQSDPHTVLAPDGIVRRSTDTIERTINRTQQVTNTTTVRRRVSDRLLETSIIPNMRSIEVEVAAEGNRPNSKMNFFFDNVNVNDYVKPENGDYGDSVITSVDGIFNATFKIPDDENLSFRSGERQFVATDEGDNQRALATSYGEAIYTAAGVRELRNRTVTTTRSTSTSRRTTGVSFEDNVVNTTYDDPLAQSFLVEQTGGMFVTELDLFFRTKDENVPVRVELHEMENGLPTQVIIPGSEVIKNPSRVNISEDGSLATTFQFDYPIYLQDQVEYCFIVISNSNGYEAWIGELGEVDLGTGQAIAEQPYAGVLFKSQNSSTWTPDQNADLMFELRKAEFDNSLIGTIELDNKDFQPIRLNSNPFESTIGSNLVTIYRKNHNYLVGSDVVITGAVAGNGIPDTELNSAHEVVDVIDFNNFVVQVTTNATEEGSFGGSAVEISNVLLASSLNPNISVLEFARTAVEFKYRGTSGKSFDGNETPYQVSTEFLPLTNYENNKLPNPILITNRTDEENNLSNNRSFKMQIRMVSDTSNISPVIDLQGASVVTPYNLITKPETTQADGSNNWGNYRTIPVGLKTAADSLRLYLDVNKPVGSDVIISTRTANTSEELSEAEWSVMNTVVSQTSGEAGYKENEYELNNLDDFTWFQVMIQLKSDSSCRVPECKRLRAIAVSA